MGEHESVLSRGRRYLIIDCEAKYNHRLSFSKDDVPSFGFSKDGILAESHYSEFEQWQD